jgi:hypothetical protein
MKVERGDETDDSMWYSFRSLYKSMVLRCPLPISDIKSSSHSLNKASVPRLEKILSWNAQLI